MVPAFGPVGTMVGSSLGGMVDGMLVESFEGDDPKPQVPQIDPKLLIHKSLMLLKIV